MFRSLKEFFTPGKPSKTPEGFEIPYDLTPSEFSQLKDLVDRPEWAVFLRALDSRVKFNAEALLSASTDENLHFHRGVIHGIRVAAFLTEEIKRAEANIKNDSVKRPPDKRSALFGTPAWSTKR